MMKTKFNFWGVMAAAAIILSAGAGYASATSQDEEATHYNATPLDAEDQTPRWEPILPGSPGENDCTPSTRDCKAVQQSDGSFNVILFGNLE